MMAAVSLLALVLSSWMTEVTAEPSKVRTFKNESGPASLRFRARGSRWVRLQSLTLQPPFGLEGVVKQVDSSSAELTLRPAYSGKFEGFSLKTQTTDVLGLFLRENEVKLNLVLESLPRALLAEARPLAVFPMVAGETPAGRGGSGQELYSIEQYQPSIDPRDILWKLVAKSTYDDGTVPVRVREANIRRAVSIGVAVSWDSDDERVKRMDLVAEAVAQMGKQLLMARTSLDIHVLLPDGSFRARVSSMPQLADASVRMWTRQSEDKLRPLLLKSDLMIVGPKEFTGEEPLAATGGSKLSVLVSEKPISSGRLGATHVFTGKEDLSVVVTEVLQR